ncbi:MAG: UvrD-helicase domain-containing protein [Candidatus Peribacteraceae bacterium]|nr:UvrD-helicase domain-containing protein [Candidatus Peribacteraceae bacterium]
MPAPDPIFGPLNEPQQEAVKNSNGPLLILAGAGSGKTRALTHRIAYLMQQGVQPWQILAVTFTNKAANEMKERIRAMLHITEQEDMAARFGINGITTSGSGRLPTMGTFHSICARILRRDIEHLGRERSFVIYDGDDQVKLMKEVLKEMGVDEKELKPKAALSYIGRFKSEAISPKEAAEQASSARLQQVARAYALYRKALHDANALDFDDLILETVKLFHECPNILDRYQETWRYLNVDEYQDTNHAQYLFITLLAQKYRNLCVIGDPDQSIYAFRGADIRNIMEFKKDYADAKEVKLEQNYRSTQVVLDAADSVIALNPNRPEKKMWTERKEGPKLLLHEVRDERAEAQEAIKAAENTCADGVPFNEQVVLYRTNAQSRLFEEACMRSGIPYRIIGGVKFYARREVKDVLAYLHVLLNPNDTVALLRILNVPTRKIGLTTLGKLQEHANRHGLTFWETLQNAEKVQSINAATLERITAFTELIERYRSKTEKEVVSHLTLSLLNALHMEKWLRDDTQEGEERWENVQELITVMHKYDSLEPMLSLTSFLEEAALISEVDALQDNTSDALTLMTLHLCKGLEFEHVMIAGCEEGIFPHSNCLFDKEQLEEECRLMYVGMTRAKTRLTLFHARSRMLWGETQANAPSRFLDELPENILERRSDDVLSAFAWASKAGQQKAFSGIEPFRQEHANLDGVEFNQDISFEEDMNQETLTEGTRIRHPSFGTGTILSKRGDVVTIQFDSGERKNFALSIAPLTII